MRSIQQAPEVGRFSAKIRNHDRPGGREVTRGSIASLNTWGTILNEWYYAEGGDPNGPHSEEAIRGLALNGTLTLQSLLWRDGMTGWSVMRDLPEFADVVPRRAPPPIPIKPPAVPQLEPVGACTTFEPEPAVDKPEPGWGEPIFVPAAERREAHRHSPWSRYFARTLDLTITSYIAGLGVGYGLVYLAPDMYRAFISQQLNVQNLILLPVAMILNGIVTGIFGTTIGKSVMGLRFTYLNGRLGILGQVGRELQVWIKGLAFGIPIVSLFTGVHQYRRLAQGLQASYDEGVALVKQDEMPGWRRALGMIFCATVFIGGIAWAYWPDNSTSYSPPASVSRAPVSWTNPVTGKVAMLPAGWSASAEDNGEGATVYVFISSDQTRQAIFGVENSVTGITDVQTYGRALKAGLQTTMTLGDFAATGTPGVLRADGTFNSEGWRTSALITQVGNRFWRIVNVDTVARGGDVTVPALTTALWSTTN